VGTPQSDASMQAGKSGVPNVGMDLITFNSSPVLGSPEAPITMIEFGDYQCFYCNNFFHNTEPAIVKNYIDTGKVKMYFKDFTIIGQDSVYAANAAHCAQEQGNFGSFMTCFTLTGRERTRAGLQPHI